MQWIQMVDDAKSIGAKYYYESYSCTLEYRESSFENIDLSVFYPSGYDGFSQLHEETGGVYYLAQDEQTYRHPWIWLQEYSEITTDDLNNTGTETCTIMRDFETSLSDIQIKSDVTLKTMVGYKVYRNIDQREPMASGYSGQQFMEWTIVESSVALATLLPVSACLLATSLMLISF